jgi:hypothetical protein
MQSRKLYVFKDDEEHHFDGVYEGYGVEERRDCEVRRVG